MTNNDTTITGVHRANLTLVDFTGQRGTWNCSHQHQSPQAAAHCAQQQIRRITPNTRDNADRTRYAETLAYVSVKVVQNGTVHWWRWSALNNIPVA